MLIVLITTSLIIFAAYIYLAATKNLNYWRERGVKYVKPLPFLGNMLPIITKSMSMGDLIKHLYNQFPDERYVGIFQFTSPILMLRDPELIKKIAIKHFENFVDHTGFIPEEVDPLWGKNLFASKGERWRDLRQTLSPVFTSSKMRAMFNLMEEHARYFFNCFKDRENLIEVELKDLCGRYTNDIIASTAFGIKCDSMKNQSNEFLMMGQELIDFSGVKRFTFTLFGSYPLLVKLFDLKMISNKVGNFFRSVINETIALREKNNVIRPDLIHSLMLARQGKLKYEEILELPEAGFAAAKESEVGKTKRDVQFLTNEDITAQALVFFLGGFDTLSTLLAFAGHELALNLDVQKRLKNEIKQTFQESEEKITYERLLAMKYLDMVVCETLRKWTQAIWVDRKCTKDFKIEPENEGESVVELKVGDVCWFPIFALHWDDKYYPNPETFDPERFSDENKDKILSGAYLPFGMGPRNCIGSRYALLGTKILLFYLLLNYDIVCVDKTQNPIKLKKDTIFLLAEKGFHVGLKRTCI